MSVLYAVIVTKNPQLLCKIKKEYMDGVIDGHFLASNSDSIHEENQLYKDFMTLFFGKKHRDGSVYVYCDGDFIAPFMKAFEYKDVCQEGYVHISLRAPLYKEGEFKEWVTCFNVSTMLVNDINGLVFESQYWSKNLNFNDWRQLSFENKEKLKCDKYTEYQNHLYDDVLTCAPNK